VATSDLQPADGRPISPSQLALWIGNALGRIQQTWVEGEVTKVQASGRGHLYFTLADAKTQLDAMVWDSDRPNAEAALAPGRTIRAHVASVRFYGPQGRLSVVVDRAREVGEGEILREIAETGSRLAADGLTDPGRRRPLPMIPRRVGVIAGRDSDARADVIDAIRMRFPPAQIVFAPALVEGPTAVDSVMAAMRALIRTDQVDVIVIARGGGSVEALRPFSNERLCRAIAAARLPIVTAIGHTKQRPNCDLVADACANVPRDVAALVVPSETELRLRLDQGQECLDAVGKRVAAQRQQLDHLGMRARGTSRIERTRGTLEGIRATLRSEVRSIDQRITRDHERVSALRSAQVAASRRRVAVAVANLDRGSAPLVASGRERMRQAEALLDRATRGLDRHDGLRRGYVLIRGADGRPVTSVAELKPGSAVDLQLADGSATASVLETHPNQDQR
jgi:exodeoxyribonuclease VII large subunit